MGRYHAADLVNAPTLISFARLPLAALFPFTLDRPGLGMTVLALAAASDVLDGFIARRFKLTSAVGAVVDGVTDKLFALAVLLSLVVVGRLTLPNIVLLGTRELLELPLVAWLTISASARRRRIDERANVFGKVATTFQFLTVFLILAHHELSHWGVWVTASVGAMAGVSYWVRTVKAVRIPLVLTGRRPSG